MCITAVVNSTVTLRVIYRDSMGKNNNMEFSCISSGSDETEKGLVNKVLNKLNKENVQILKIEKEFKQLGGYI